LAVFIDPPLEVAFAAEMGEEPSEAPRLDLVLDSGDDGVGFRGLRVGLLDDDVPRLSRAAVGFSSW
jgi:hypothetical protein